MQLLEAGPPPATPKDLMDETYERSFSDPTDELLSALNESEGIQSGSMDATPTLPTVADPQVAATMPPVAEHVQAGDPPTNILPKTPPTKSRHRRPSASPPPTLTSTRLRPRITPSKYGSAIADSANARRTQPPKTQSPSPPIPSQIRAMSMASSAQLAPNASATKIVVDNDPFQITNAAASRSQLNHGGAYPYGTQYRPPPQMVSPYATSYPQGHGFPPMNMAHYGHDYHPPYNEVSNYGPLTGIQHPMVGPGYPHPHFQQPSGYPYFSAPGEIPYPGASRESTAAPRETTPSLPLTDTGHYFVAPDSQSLSHASGSAIPPNTSSNENNSASNGTEKPSEPAKASQRQPSNILPKAVPIELASSGSDAVLVPRGPGTELPLPNRLASTLVPASDGRTTPIPEMQKSEAVSAGSSSAAPDQREIAKMFNDPSFTTLHIPPGPIQPPPIVKISPPTPAPPVTPRHSSSAPLVSAQSIHPASVDSPTDYDIFLENDSPTIGRLSKSKEEALITGFKALNKLVKEISVSSGLSVIQIVERWNGGIPRSLNSWNIYQVFIKKHLAREIGRLISIKKTKSLWQDLGPFCSFSNGLLEAPSDEIAALQTTLDEGGNFSSKVISDAYDGFQAAFPDNADKLLHAWAQVNVMDSDKSVGQRAGNFKKQCDQFRTLVSVLFSGVLFILVF
jgi:hypothetical protein